MFDDFTEEQKKEIKKNIESFKIKIHWELDHSDDDVLIFGNNRISTSVGDLRKVLFKLAIIIDQISMQTGKNRKGILKDLKQIFRLVDVAKAREE